MLDDITGNANQKLELHLSGVNLQDSNMWNVSFGILGDQELQIGGERNLDEIRELQEARKARTNLVESGELVARTF